MTIGEKVSYLKGLIEGLDIDKGKKESKIILAMVDIIEDLALTVDDIEEDLDEVMDFVEELDGGSLRCGGRPLRRRRRRR